MNPVGRDKMRVVIQRLYDNPHFTFSPEMV
jgi:hypothetical protein